MPKRKAPRSRPAAPPPVTRITAVDLAWLAVFVGLLAVLVVRNYFLDLPQVPVLPLGPLRLSIFGLLVGLGMLFGFYLTRRWCEGFGLDWEGLSSGLVWMVAGGVIGAHLVSMAAYFPAELGDLAALLDPRSRLASFGGFFGGAAAAAVHLRRRRLPAWRHGDSLVYGFTGGYLFGRMGCFAIHDHPGPATDLPLGVEIQGVVRHDVGLYEMLLVLLVFVALRRQARGGRPPDGAAAALAVTLYMPLRFLLEFLRIGDPRYLALTPGQWLSLPAFAIGLWAWRIARRAANRDRAAA